MRGFLVAVTVSGVPSTVYALVTGRSPLEATRAAGTLLGGSLASGVLAHVVISAWWTFVLRRLPLDARSGAVGGAVIALLDLEIIGRRYPAIRALPRVPQWLDHVVFGAVTGHYVRARRAQVRRYLGANPYGARELLRAFIKAWNLPQRGDDDRTLRRPNRLLPTR